MKFYPSKNHDILNGLPFHPETVTRTAMLNPHYPRVTIAPGTQEVVVDSGAFQERDMKRRRSPAEALARQLALVARLRQQGQPRFVLVTYDMLLGVDEALVNGKRVKRRGTEETATEAVEETLRSAVYYASQRGRLGDIGIAYSAQGATVAQYSQCVAGLLDVMIPGDWLAFGGFCIVGRMPSLKPQFIETVRAVLPLLRRKGIRRAHILGVCVHDALIAAAAEGRKHGVALSTDSSSVEMNSIHGRVWDVAHMRSGRRGSPWRQVFTKAQKKGAGAVSYHPCTLAIENIARFAAWSGSLSSPTHAVQGALWPCLTEGERALVREAVDQDHQQTKHDLRQSRAG